MSTTIANNSLNLFSDTTKTVSAREYTAASADNENSIIGKDTFLQIMIAKLSNQDPLNPTDDTEFLSQLAQFTTLEQTINMTEAMTAQQGFDMVGKYVVAEYGSSYITGRVDSVVYDGGEITLDIGGVLVGMDNIKEVLAEPYKSDTSSDGESGEQNGTQQIGADESAL